MALILSGDTGPSIVQSAAQPAGCVLQVVQTATNTYIATTSTSFVTTSFGISITPRSTSSKIFVTTQGGGAFMGTGAGISMYSTIYRNSTNLGNATYGLERLSTPGGSWVLAPHSMSVLDSPSTTSSISYMIYFRSATGAEVQFSNDDRGVVTITAMEIQG